MDWIRGFVLKHETEQLLAICRSRRCLDISLGLCTIVPGRPFEGTQPLGGSRQLPFMSWFRSKADWPQLPGLPHIDPETTK